MEFIPLSDTVLRYLAEDDRELRPYFRGVFPADKIPPMSKKQVNAFIVNTDPGRQPGEHWLALWTEGNTFEVSVMDYRCLVIKIRTYKLG